MKKKFLMLLMAGMLGVFSLAGCSSFEEDEVVMTVGEQKVTADIANFYARYVQAQYETYYSAYLGEDMWNSEAAEGKTYEESVKDSVLESLEDMVVLEAHMKDYDMSLSDEEKKIIEDAAKKFDSVNALEDKEKVSGSEETIKRVMTLMAIQKKMQSKIQEGADTEVSDEEAAQKSMQYVLFSYKTKDEDGNTKDMTDKEKKEVDKKAEEFAKGVKDAEDFEAYAKEKELEVEKGTFDSESKSPAEALIKEADKLNEGEITGVVKSDYGCYVAKVTSMLDREATDARKDTIVNDRKQELYADTCKEWRKDADIKVDQEVWKKIDFKDLKVTIREEVKDPYSNNVETDDVADAKKEAEENAD